LTPFIERLLGNARYIIGRSASIDYETYRKNFFVDPAPIQIFSFEGLHGASLYFEEFDRALAYYTEVLGPPAYVEEEYTRGWQLDNTWLTLLLAREGNPRNAEINLVMSSAQEAERLQAAFIAAGGAGPSPSDALIFVPIRICPVIDPFGMQIMNYAAL